MSDHELLQHYARQHDQAAFAALVERHLALVYSAARRQVRSTHLAEEVAQSVFLDLARHAARFPSDRSLVAWLHIVTRRSAIDVVRREARRQSREHAAAQLTDAPAMTPAPDPWSEVEPLLDEAVETLGEPDRTAILLRFFQNKSLREVGAALGTSDDAAQKRVTRALDQLRTFFLRRGVAVSTGGLTTTLSAHALTTVPAGLGVSISTATTLSAAAAAEGTRVVLMTTLQKSLAAAALVVLGGGALYQASLIAAQSSELAALTAQREGSAAELRRLDATRTALAARLKDVERAIDTRLTLSLPLSPADAALQTQMQTWLTQVNQLKRLFKDRPELSIPELKMLSDEDWFKAVSTDLVIFHEKMIPDLAARIRRRAEELFTPKLSQAVKTYIDEHQGLLPTRMQELAAYLDPSIDPASLDRYELARQGNIAEVAQKDRMALITLKEPLDVERDMYIYIGYGYGHTPASAVNQMKARDAYAAAHNGERPPRGAELSDYLPWPSRASTGASRPAK